MDVIAYGADDLFKDNLEWIQHRFYVVAVIDSNITKQGVKYMV